MTFRCGCGQELPFRDVDCLNCGAAYELRPGWRAARCACGAISFAAPGQVGTSIPCASCFLRVTVGAESPPAPPALKRAGRRVSKPAVPSGGIRDRLRWLFPLTLLPLVLYAFTTPSKVSLRELVEKAQEENPRFREKRESIKTLDDLFTALEIERVEGAYLSRFALNQWVYAMAAAGGFWALIVGLFPLGRANSLHLWTVGLLMGTAGVLLLLGMHKLPFVKQLLAAATGDTGLFTSLVGYTLGVGVLEELVKLLPLAIVLRVGVPLDARGAIAWGLAMGAGFGVSEAIYYAGEVYNGFAPGLVYVVRFVSCVALHMAWSGTAAAGLWRSRDELRDGLKIFVIMLLASAGPIALHGLYDGLLKFGGTVGALCTAGLTFVYFFWSSDRAIAAEKDVATS